MISFPPPPASVTLILVPFPRIRDRVCSSRTPRGDRKCLLWTHFTQARASLPHLFILNTQPWLPGSLSQRKEHKVKSCYVFLLLWVTFMESWSLLGLSFFICKMGTENYLSGMEVLEMMMMMVKHSIHVSCVKGSRHMMVIIILIGGYRSMGHFLGESRVEGRSPTSKLPWCWPFDPCMIDATFRSLHI